MRVPVSEAKEQLTELVKRAEAGDEVILTRHGHDVARLLAVAVAPGLKGRRALMEKIRAAAAAKALPGPAAARSQDFLYGDELAAQTPNARQKEIMRVAANGKIGKIGKRHAAAFVIDFSNGGVAAENLHHLDIEQVRGMQCLMRRIEKTALHRFRRWRAKQDLQQC